jgi:hypothetical protein
MTQFIHSFLDSGDFDNKILDVIKNVTEKTGGWIGIAAA